MLGELHIRNFAVVEQMELRLREGMTVFTGETGAGKSILIEAVGLVLGDRARPTVIRQGCTDADIAAIFDIRDDPAVKQLLASNGIECAEDECILRRQLSVDGRSRAYVNGLPVPLRALQTLGERLVDIHGQHAHYSLLQPAAQRQLLDDFADHGPLLDDTKKTYREWSMLTSALAELDKADPEDAHRSDTLSHEIGELQATVITAEQLQALEQEHTTLANVNLILTQGQRALTLLGAEAGVTDKLRDALKELRQIQTLQPKINPAVELLENAAIQLEEAGTELRHHLHQLEPDPERLAQIERQLSALHDLARKHHTAVQNLAQTLAELKQRLSARFEAESKRAELTQSQTHLLQRFHHLAAQLSASRAQHAKELAIACSEHFQHLGMRDAELLVHVTPVDSDEPSPEGMDTVEFLISTNPGQAPLPLRHSASGGELSRIGLALQVVAVRKHGIGTLIFDEVDAGIGGGTAQIVGRLLRQLGEHRQVLCVTHLPQVAVEGHHHVGVTKRINGEATQTVASVLDLELRIGEIARMLGGIQITQQTLAHAREMLLGSEERAGANPFR
ncbi:MAG: DNA repair protein RecN [Gammaproteobacteria bacterium]